MRLRTQTHTSDEQPMPNEPHEDIVNGRADNVVDGSFGVVPDAKYPEDDPRSTEAEPQGPLH